MATAKLPQESMDLGGVASLANLFLGKETNTTGGSVSQNSGGVTSSGTQTTSENVSPEAVNALVKSILEGNQGLAAVSSGQRKAGLYNSSTNMMLTNDLIARAAAEGAKLNKSTTVTKNEVQSDNRATATQQVQSQQTPAAINPSKTALLLGGMSLIPADVKKSLLQSMGIGKNVAAPVKTAGSGNSSDPMSQGSGNDSTSPAGSSVANPTQAVTPMSTAAAGTGVNVGAGGASAGFQVPIVDDATGNVVDFGDAFSNLDSVDYGTPDMSGIDLSGTGDILNDWQPDVGADSGLEFGDDIDFGQFFAEGGLVTRRQAAIDAAEDAAVKGEDVNQAVKDTNSAERKDLKGNEKKSAVPLIVRKLFGFAEGGIVNTGLRQRAKPGVQYDPLTVLGGNDQEITDSVAQAITAGRIKGTGSTNTAGLKPTTTRTVTPSRAAPRLTDKNQEIGEGDSTSNDSASSPGTAEGTSGIGVSSTAAAAGLSAVGIGAPGLSGLSTATSNSQAVTSVASAIASAIASPVTGLVVNALLNNISSTTGSTTPGVDADAANAISAINDSDPLDALVSMIDANLNGADTAATSSTGVTDSQGAAVGSGSGAGSGGVGTAGDGGVGGDGVGGTGDGGAGAYKKGGEIDGPGTETSDSIPIRVSDGEYVVNAAATQAFLPILEAINNHGRQLMKRGGR